MRLRYNKAEKHMLLSYCSQLRYEDWTQYRNMVKVTFWGVVEGQSFFEVFLRGIFLMLPTIFGQNILARNKSYIWTSI